ncbi:MAG: hypothetical protein AAGA75_24055 [Cyanobacteria bacterium P01_E01_bin.6]
MPHDSVDNIEIRNQETLEELAQTLEWSVGEFHLYLVRCNYASVRSHLIDRLTDICRLSLYTIHLTPETETLFTDIQAELALLPSDASPDAVLVTGFEQVADLDRLFAVANNMREDFRKGFNLPLVFWLDDAQFNQFNGNAPDIASLAPVDTPILAIATPPLVHSIEQGIAAIYQAAFDPTAMKLPQAVKAIDTFGDLHQSELVHALRDLRDRKLTLAADLKADVNLLQGIYCIDDSDPETNQAVGFFLRSVDHWRQQAASGHPADTAQPQNSLSSSADIRSNVGANSIRPDPSSSAPSADIRSDVGANSIRPDPSSSAPSSSTSSSSDVRANAIRPYPFLPTPSLKLALALYFLGRQYFWVIDSARRSDLSHYTDEDWEQARVPLAECIQLFDAAGLEYMVAKVIRRLEGCLRRLGRWDDLEVLATRGIALHQTYAMLDRLAMDYGFCAEVALQRQRWAEAKVHAQQSLDTLSQAPRAQRWAEGLYLSLLAEAEAQLGETAAAVAHLEQARDLGDRGHPTTYCKVLEALRRLYRQQKRYLDAFKTKQARLEVEKVAGIRAFVGAGRLGAQADRMEESENPSEYAPEIYASGRQRDLDNLLERIGRNDYKLIVIHGFSGVGKSSLVNAGLIPVLKKRAIGTRGGLPVLVRKYTDWVGTLGLRLEEAFDDCVNRRRGA